MVSPRTLPQLPCPVCGTPVVDSGAAPCPACGLPAAGRAAHVVGRITATLTELARDREALLVTLRAAAPGAAATAPPPVAVPVPPPPAPSAEPVAAAVRPWHPLPPPDRTPPPPRRRLSPQQVLLGLGALLVVAGALAFVALGWTRFGLVFQATVMLTGTAAACAASAFAARRGLRATEEALAAAGAALLAVDLGAARARGLLGLDEVGLRTWTAVSCLVLVAVALGLGRLTRSTLTWPLAALLALQPVPVLLLPGDAPAGPAGVAVVLGLAAADLALVLTLRPALRPVARVLAVLWAAVGVTGGVLLGQGGSAPEAWTATALLTAAAAVAVPALRDPRVTGRPLPARAVALASGAVVGLSLGQSLGLSGPGGPVLGGVLALLLSTAGVLLAGPQAVRGPHPVVLRALGGAAVALAVVAGQQLLDAGRYGPLALLVLAATLPAALAAVRVPVLRSGATGLALLAPAAGALLAREGGLLSATTAGLLVALVGAAGFAVATGRAAAPEEQVAAAAGAVAGAVAGLTTSADAAWGQVGLQLGVVGVAAGCYAVVAGRRPVGLLAVADLVLASWIAVGGAGVETPEAYTLPAAAGLLVAVLPRLRARGPSWAAEGPAVAVALAPSAFAVVAAPTALRLVLVVAAAVALVVLGTLTHRQAPFVVGAGALAFVVVARLGPYAPLLPRWLTLAAAGLVLLVLGATYERRRQQAREAVAWVAQMG
ncbi:hypothetical protein O2W14_11010 [Modestobacter sp. VKM Ac-2986]|uniref:SCO7613 C-terminal domain-containing membrane protein n=1 Tax=Modestobacter sp. VKM Ac-2986 TaxID=3004140 RepID=UPI0022AB6463|nr:hypothetical protein [Modestobacter sp. VKM Ac-2986]MCZ2829363.1 hypothetical protein [Modestobacter sp. VKM Ac-2986]